MTDILLQAEPAPIALDPGRTALIIIDMQRDFLEPGGFGETLGNDVSLLRRAIAPCAEARAAAFIITNSESAAYHLPRLRERAADSDPETRDRFLAGALIPAAWVSRAQRVRRWWLDQVIETFNRIDLILAPATPFRALRIDQQTVMLGGVEVPARPNIGMLAQPFSCIGLPIVTVPVFSPGEMPIGVQLIAPPWREDLCLRAAHHLEGEGVAVAHPPKTAGINSCNSSVF